MDIIKQLSQFSAATLHEALGKTGNLPSGIKPLSPKMKVCGPAYTVKTMPCDNMLLHRAYAYAKAGDVLVVNCSNFYEAGYWGDLMSLGAMTKGIAGLIIDGCVRDDITDVTVRLHRLAVMLKNRIEITLTARRVARLSDAAAFEHE